MDTFHQRLIEYCDRDYYPWHMPGHKRRYPDMQNGESPDNSTEDAPAGGIDSTDEDSLISGNESAVGDAPEDKSIRYMNAAKYYDVTELPGLDSLHDPEAELKISMERLTAIYGSAASYYMVNGSTGGILTAISAVCRRGDTILMARNCHRSVYHAVALLELTPVYLYPPQMEELYLYGGITGRQVADAIALHPEIRAVVLTSPTYEGVVSDIADIVNVAHAAGKYIIVDEAHGAHYTFDAQEIASAVALGADLVIESLHKTLPCYTQCAILHVGRNSLPADYPLIRQVERYLRVYETSSPSYLFVADMERVIAEMDQWRKAEFIEYYERLRRFRQRMERLNYIRLLSAADVLPYGAYQYDETKLVFIPKTVSGEQLCVMLEKNYGLVMEMASLKYTLAISTVMDSEQAFDRLEQALQELDQSFGNMESIAIAREPAVLWLPVLKEDCAELTRQQAILKGNDTELAKNPSDLGMPKGDGELIPGIAWNLETELVPIERAEGRLAGDYVTVYPPGIPVCVPGEKMTRAVIEYIMHCYQEGLTVHGIIRTEE